MNWVKELTSQLTVDLEMQKFKEGVLLSTKHSLAIVHI